ncbi:5-bromo-4-chloroindolyl phosphate hydrolysis family protein [Enterococcus asini]|uniref:5-bromo-4-chloroindolyl phosphate hydrolysis family protein n=1 Tax=Enterococcus TaxID=1350 RepID=UPI00195D5016|nr:5-bromo-4-chloroindolyl phosphate hydrolysis family protein [Enterococcus asini]
MMYFVVVFVSLFGILAFVTFQITDRWKKRRLQLAKLADYKECNKLSERDLNVFKNAMAEAKVQIIQGEDCYRKLAKSSQQGKVKAGLEAAKGIFQYLMKEPQQLTQYGDFLYRDLPGFINALSHYQDFMRVPLAAGEWHQQKHNLEGLIAEFSQIIVDDFLPIGEEQVQDAQTDLTVVEKGSD